MRTLLIDGDMVAWVHAATAERSVNWGDGVTSYYATETPEATAARIGGWVRDIQELLHAEAAVFCLSAPRESYFRMSVWPDYKKNRTHAHKPGPLSAIRELLNQKFNTKIKATLEADDVLGILGTHPKLIKGERVIVTQDKDLLQIPGLHFNPRRTEHGVTRVSDDEARRWFYYQTLTGDGVDGFPGCPGVGPARANRLLPKVGTDAEYWQIVTRAYEDRGQTAEQALTQARVARICQWSDWDFKNNTVKLWQPPEKEQL